MLLLDMIQGYLTIAETADRLGVSAGRVRQFVAENRVETLKIGKSNLIKESDVSKLTVYGKVGRPKKASP